jgi:hypothetical protein
VATDKKLVFRLASPLKPGVSFIDIGRESGAFPTPTVEATRS